MGKSGRVEEVLFTPYRSSVRTEHQSILLVFFVWFLLGCPLDLWFYPVFLCLVELASYRKKRWEFKDGWLVLEAF